MNLRDRRGLRILDHRGCRCISRSRRGAATSEPCWPPTRVRGRALALCNQVRRFSMATRRILPKHWRSGWRRMRRNGVWPAATPNYKDCRKSFSGLLIICARRAECRAYYEQHLSHERSPHAVATRFRERPVPATHWWSCPDMVQDRQRHQSEPERFQRNIYI